MNPCKSLIIIVFFLFVLLGCATEPEPQISYDPAALRFDGQQALATEAEFVTQFPNRDSGQPNNRLAAEWIQTQFTELGFDCTVQEWEIINYSQPLPLNNVICSLPGESPQEIVIMAHHDQFSGTSQGADNDGSGIAILLELAQIFAIEGTPAYTLTFVSSDGEEYGMVGSGHYIANHPKPDQIIAAFSLDNLGKKFYDGVLMSVTGQLRDVGPLWLQRTAQEAARKAGDIWVPAIKPTYEQIITQAVPISYWDQGPIVAAGVPAIGFGGNCPAEFTQECWDTFHTEQDTMEFQSPVTLHNSGRIVEATVRQLLAMEQFPEEAGPYLYFPESNATLRGPALWLIFIGFVFIFLLGSLLVARKPLPEIARGWLTALPHIIGLWLPWVFSVIVLYLLVEVGLMLKFAVYPATSRDPEIFNPRWPAVIIYVLSLALFFWLGRMLTARLQREIPDFWMRKSLTLLIVGLGGIYMLYRNPFSLMFLLPTLLWFLIRGRLSLAGRILDWIFVLGGGLVVYALFYFFGFLFLHNDLTILWYILMMFSIRQVGFLSMTMIAMIIAAGLSLVVNPPKPVSAQEPAFTDSDQPAEMTV